MNADSPTQAMSAVFERHAISVEEYVRAFACRDRQCGVAFAIGAEFGLDLFDHPATMRSLFAKLVRSYALDAMDLAKTPADDGSVDPAAFLKALADASAASEPAIGMGKDVRLAGKSVAGAALWEGGRYVDICGFTVGQGSKENSAKTRLSRPTRRRTGACILSDATVTVCGHRADSIRRRHCGSSVSPTMLSAVAGGFEVSGF